MAKARLSLPVLIGLAIAGGAIAGGAALYASGALNDKSATQIAAVNTCPARSPLADIVAQNAAGDVKTLTPTDARSLADLKFNGPDGAAMTLADKAGKTIILNLWATWCAPCREEMPDLDRLQSAKGDESFEVIALSLDRGDDTKPQDFYKEVGIQNLAHYRDGTLGVFNRLRGEGLVLGLPVTLVIDKNSCLAAQMSGPAHWGGDDAFKLADALKAASY